MMKKRALGSSGLSVFPIGLGAMPMSIRPERDESEGIRVILAALEAGVELIDTADAYSLDEREANHNERLIAKALREWRGHRVVVATKGGLVRPEGRWERNGRPEHLRFACERSLQALGTERIDLYQLHAPDPDVPFEDSVGALADLQREGKIEHVGLSNVSVAQLVQARSIVDVVSVQNKLNLFDRQALKDGVVRHCEEEDLAFLPFSPVGGGNGRVRTRDSTVVNDLARAHEATPFEVALAWLLAKSPVMIPIPGASKVESILSSVRAADLVLTAAELKRLDDELP